MSGVEEKKNYLAFTFGCLPPKAGEKVMLEQIKKRNDFWNKLVEIEKEYKEKVAQIMYSETTAQIERLNQELNEVREEIKKQRKIRRTGKVDVSELQTQAEDIKVKIKELKQKLKDERQEIFDTRKQEILELDEQRRAAIKQAQKESELYWCNYEEVLRSYDVARKKVKKDKGELRFHRFDGTGKVTVRFQTGLSIEEVFSCRNTLLQIDPIDKDAWYNPIRAIRRKKSRTTVRLRVCSENRKPVFVELPVVLHREIPENALIKTASIIRERVGRKFRYKLNIVLELLGESQSKNGSVKKGIAAIDLGWRSVKDGLRVAYLLDSEENQEELVLSHNVLYEFQKVTDLQSIRDKLLNETKEQLVELIKNIELPEEFKEKTKAITEWRSQKRLYNLYLYWKEHRIPGDDEIMALLDYWAKREIHLYDWQANLRDQVLRRRREIYRVFAARITRKYGTILLEKFNLKENIAKKPAPEKGTAGSLPVDRNRFIAAISELREVIKRACEKNNVLLEFIPAENTTMTCNKCGHKEKFDSADQIMHTCPKCKELWDQDANAAANLLSSFANTC